MIVPIKAACEKASKSGDFQELDYKCWLFPERRVSWLAYIFYGCSIKNYHLDWFRSQVDAIALADVECEGIFFIDEDEADEHFMWSIKNGVVTSLVREISIVD
jgi:hypothetical protein